MTTITVPDVDLEQWLAGEIEQPCECLNWDGSPCGSVADWLLTFRLRCDHPKIRHFMCTGCKGFCTRFPRDWWRCDVCQKPAELTFTERIRSPR